jgi:hypothetical protein
MDNQNKKSFTINGPENDRLEVKFGDFYINLCELAYNAKKDPEKPKEKIRELFNELTCYDIKSRPLSYLYYPFEMTARHLDNVMPVMIIADDMRAEEDYKKRDIKSPIPIAYLSNLDSSFHGYVDSLESVLNTIREMDGFHPWGHDPKTRGIASKTYDYLETLAYFPPIVKTLESMTQLGKESREICEEFDNKRFNIVQRVNQHLKSDPNDGM